MVNKLMFFSILIMVTTSFGNKGRGVMVNINIQNPHSGKSSPLLYSAGIFSNPKKTNYYEAGIIAQPNFSDYTYTAIDERFYSREYDHSLFGLYGGYHLIIFPIFRPGIVGGMVMKKDRLYYSETQESFTHSEDSEYNFSSYLGLSIHMGIFTFLITNVGIGGGLNFAL